MSTTALKTCKSVEASQHGTASLLSGLARAVDIWAMVAALPIFIVAGWPILGWLTAALIWLGQRAVQAFFGRKIDQTQDQRRVVGLVAGSTMVRAWSAAIVILIVGLQDKKVGLSAVVMVIGLFTVYFASSLLQRVMSGDPGSAKGSNK